MSTPADESAQWKQKYLDNLEQLEVSEKQWEQTETLLRNTVIRLCLAAEGVDKDLDKQLDNLRKLARKRSNNEQIASILSAINKTLVKLDSKKKERSITPADVMLELLKRLDLPRGGARKAKGLRKKLEKAGEDTPYRPLIAEFSELLAEIPGKVTDTVQEPGQEKREEKEGGLLGKLFSKEKQPAEKPSGETTLSTGMASEVLLQVFVTAGLPARYQKELADLQASVARSRSEKELLKLARSLGQLFDEAACGQAGAAHAPASEEPEATETDSQAQEETTPTTLDEGTAKEEPAAGEILLQLLERMDLPPDSDEALGDIKPRLDGAVAMDEWPDILKKIADVVHGLREGMQQEKKALEQFLVQLTGRLDEIDGSISGMEQSRIEAREDSLELGKVVTGEVSHMHDGIEVSTSIDDIKSMIQQRLGHISEHMNQFREREEKRNDEAQQQIEQLSDKLQQLDSESSALRDRMKKTREASMRDRLTGLLNRTAYEEKLAEEFARWKRYLEPLTLAVFDIDHFKRINDTYGHQAGDKALRTIAQLLLDKTRETDIIARYGGEEFVMLMPGTKVQEALVVAEKLRDEVQNCGFHYKNTSVVVTISCGICEFLGEDTPTEVFARADKALYQCKENGRNQCQVSSGR
jgi:diguanylate cyclase